MKKVKSYLSDLPRIKHQVSDTFGFLNSGPTALSMYYVNSKYSQMYILELFWLGSKFW